MISLVHLQSLVIHRFWVNSSVFPRFLAKATTGIYFLLNSLVLCCEEQFVHIRCLVFKGFYLIKQRASLLRSPELLPGYSVLEGLTSWFSSSLSLHVDWVDMMEGCGVERQLCSSMPSTGQNLNWSFPQGMAFCVCMCVFRSTPSCMLVCVCVSL